MNKNFQSLMGKKFNYLTVIELHHKKLMPDGRNKYYWKCVCDCGTIKIVVGESLKYGDRISCGCKRTSHNKKTFGESCFNEIYCNYKRRAKQKNVPFTLTKDDFRDLILLDCGYCGFPPSSVQKNSLKFGSFKYNGIDRIECKLGYTKENTLTCCGFCNRAKFIHSIEEFKNWLSYVKK